MQEQLEYLFQTHACTLVNVVSSGIFYFQARVIGSDALTDLAVLQIDEQSHEPSSDLPQADFSPPPRSRLLDKIEFPALEFYHIADALNPLHLVILFMQTGARKAAKGRQNAVIKPPWAVKTLVLMLKIGTRL